MIPIALMVVATYAFLVSGLLLLFPRNPVTLSNGDDASDGPRFYPCGCRRVGAVGSPGCDDCTEPGLR